MKPLCAGNIKKVCKDDVFKVIGEHAGSSIDVLD